MDPIKKQPARVLSFVNQKGGTGKTTIAQNLATCFGLLHEKRILCIDLDTQGNFGQGLTREEISSPKTADRLLVVPKANINEYITPLRPNIDLIHNYFQKDIHETVEGLPLYPDLLRKQLAHSMYNYDYIMLDTPAGLCKSTQIGLDASDQIILVVSCGIYGLKGMVAVVDWMRGTCMRLGKAMPQTKVVLNNYDDRRRYDREFKLNVQRIFGADLYQTQIRTSTRVAEAAACGMGVIEYCNESPVAGDFRRLSREILGLPPDELTSFECEDELEEVDLAKLDEVDEVNEEAQREGKQLDEIGSSREEDEDSVERLKQLLGV
ncbi:MAG: ParA family protein [Blastocatellia bacterium]|nr:ParA family protein [Blastocatellia bacterium]